MQFPEFHTYEEEKAFSARLDLEFGLRVTETERSLRDPQDGAQRWIKQGADTFLTPYSEFWRMLQLIEPLSSDTVVDLGAGYGRLGFVLKDFPGVHFLGYELVPERVEEGKRALEAHGCVNARLVQADLTEVTPASAPFYFIYDYGVRTAVEKTLADLREISLVRGITVVARGREVRDQIERQHPWLTVVEPEQHGHFTIYRSREL